MPTSYADTLAYDLVVVFFVAVLMPTSVLLLRSRSAAGKGGGAALLALSVLYVGGFEHYRLHAPEARGARARMHASARERCAACARVQRADDAAVRVLCIAPVCAFPSLHRAGDK
jgi:hypothetical protein